MKSTSTLLSNRADRIAALGRLAIAAFSAAAAFIDTPTPAATADIVVNILGFYLGFAAGFTLWIWRRGLDEPPVGRAPHAIDLIVIAALVYLTNGISSPFFALYIFAILSATLKWNAAGALWTTGIITLLFLPTALVGIAPLDPDKDEVLRYAVRLIQIVVAGGMLVTIGAQRERIWDELFRLSRRIDRGSGSLADCAGHCAEHVRAFFDAPRAIVFWNHHEEPGWHALEATPGGIRQLPLLRHAAAPIADARPGTIWRWEAGKLATGLVAEGPADDPPPEGGFDPALIAPWQVQGGLFAAIGSDTLSAWLLLPDAEGSADAPLLRALAPQLIAAFAEAGAAWAWQAAQADGARLEVARDLHDGVLQFLAGLALQLKIIARQAGNPEAISRRIEALEVALRAEQAELRRFVDGAGQTHGDDDASLADLLARLASQWDIVIDGSDCADPPPALAADIGRITREAVANAVRHGGATLVTVQGAMAGSAYRLIIGDNGRGMIRHGSFDVQQLRSGGIGPQSILARVDALGGKLRLSSTPSGVHLDMTLPCSEVLAA